MTSMIRQELRGAVLEITLDDPDRLNVFDPGMADALLEALRSPPAAARAVLLRASGRFFSAGGDIRHFQWLQAADDAQREAGFAAIIDSVHRLVAHLQRLPLPVAAAVQGGAAGFAVSLLAACDWVVAADNAVFSMAYMGLGVTPDGGATWHLPRLLGLRAARRLILMNAPCPAAEALRLGLVDEVVAPDALVDASRQAAAGRLKHLLAGSGSRDLPGQLAAEKEAFLAGSRSRDFREGLAAFGERRPPVFLGC